MFHSDVQTVGQTKFMDNRGIAKGWGFLASLYPYQTPGCTPGVYQWGRTMLSH